MNCISCGLKSNKMLENIRKWASLKKITNPLINNNFLLISKLISLISYIIIHIQYTYITCASLFKILCVLYKVFSDIGNTIHFFSIIFFSCIFIKISKTSGLCNVAHRFRHHSHQFRCTSYSL